MQITLDFNEGVNPPDNLRDVLVLSKESGLIVKGNYVHKLNKYFVDSVEMYLLPEQVMWAEQPKNINKNKKLYYEN